MLANREEIFWMKAESLRIRLDGETKDKVVALFDAKKVKHQTAVENIMRWVLAQDDLLQSVILGQLNVGSEAEVIALISKRYASRPRDPRRKPARVAASKTSKASANEAIRQ